MTAEISLSVLSDRPAEQVFEMSRELMHDLGRIAGIDVHPASATPIAGQRGFPAEAASEFLITVIGGSAGIALADCIRSYFARDRALVLRMRRVDGVEITMEADRAKDLDSAVLLAELERFLHPR